MSRAYDRFDTMARSERYFTATLLPHILMAKSFSGLKALIKEVFGKLPSQDHEAFEIVSELDPIRDAAIYHASAKSKFKSSGRMSVPDLFVRWGNLAVVIEAKFFTDPSDEDLCLQIDDQKSAVDVGLQYTKYPSSGLSVIHLGLSVSEGKLDLPYQYLLWSKLTDMLKKALRPTASEKDLIYCFERLEEAIERAREEQSKSSGIRWSNAGSIDNLIKNLGSYVKDGRLWVGLIGGERALNELDKETFINRPWRVTADKNHGPNWFPLHRLIEHYFKVVHGV